MASSRDGRGRTARPSPAPAKSAASPTALAKVLNRDALEGEMYEVELRCEGGQLVHDCSCPHAAEGNFCKHCVATGLAWLAERGSAERSGSPPDQSGGEDPWQTMGAFLEKQPKRTLISLHLEVAQRTPSSA